MIWQLRITIKHPKMTFKIKDRVGSKPPLARIALILIIIGSVSFGNYPKVGYTVLGLGFALGAYADLFVRKRKKLKE